VLLVAFKLVGVLFGRDFHNIFTFCYRVAQNFETFSFLLTETFRDTLCQTSRLGFTNGLIHSLRGRKQGNKKEKKAKRKKKEHGRKETTQTMATSGM
jgi:uncharacterized membrane protein YciS (DUF1049 family)